MAETQKSLADRLFPVVADAEETEIRNIPPEQRRLHTETADLTVASLHQYITSGKIRIPEFQRHYVWTRTQASRLIESLIIQCPIPVVYFSQGSDNVLAVVDGNQRLLTIKLFLNDAFELQGLTTYPELNGYSWLTLDPRFKDHIGNRTIRCITILKDTHPQIKFDVFERLNTGSVKLNAQELRHGINHGALMDALETFAKNPGWRTAVSFGKDKRMKGEELVLRYLAFRHDRAAYEKPMAAFLDTFSARYRNVDKQIISEWKSDFDRAFALVDHALGRQAFRFFKLPAEATSPFNAALYDAEMVAFASTKNRKILNKAFDPADLKIAIHQLLADPKYTRSIRQATSDETAVRDRIDGMTKLLDAF